MSKDLSICKVSKPVSPPPYFDENEYYENFRFVDKDRAETWEKEIGTPISAKGCHTDYYKFCIEEHGCGYEYLTYDDNGNRIFHLTNGKEVVAQDSDLQKYVEDYSYPGYVYNYEVYSSESDYNWAMCGYEDLFNILYSKQKLGVILKTIIADNLDAHEAVMKFILNLTYLYFDLKDHEYAILLYE